MSPSVFSADLCCSIYACVCVGAQYEDVADKDDLMGVEDTAKKGE